MFGKLRQRSRTHFGSDHAGLEREFDKVYRSLLLSRGIRSDEEELEFLHRLISGAEHGEFPQSGTMHIVSPDVDVDYRTDGAVRAATPPAAPNYGPLVGVSLVAAAVLFLLLSAMVGKRTNTTPVSASSAEETLEAARAASAMTATTTAYAAATQTAISQVAIDWTASSVVIGSGYKEKLPFVYPETLEIDGIPFRVYPTAINTGSWVYRKLAGTASWIAGSVINWSFGIPAVEQNNLLFQRLGEAGETRKEAIVRMSGGVVRRFILQKPVQIDRQQIEVFAQDRPGITLVLLGEEQGAKRWLVTGSEEYGLFEVSWP